MRNTNGFKKSTFCVVQLGSFRVIIFGMTLDMHFKKNWPRQVSDLNLNVTKLNLIGPKYIRYFK